MPNVHLVVGLLKRWLLGTFHGASAESTSATTWTSSPFATTAGPRGPGGCCSTGFWNRPFGPEPDLRLVTAAEQQHTRRVRDLVRDGVDVNTSTADGVTPLLWTAHWDDHETVDLLLRAGADVNAAEDHGVTPLAMACENASATMVDRLLAAGADPDAAQTNGVDPADDRRTHREHAHRGDALGPRR